MIFFRYGTLGNDCEHLFFNCNNIPMYGYSYVGIIHSYFQNIESAMRERLMDHSFKWI